ncbi:polysaccharide pyruvyl transferase family protein [Colwelliaceae bacterium 6471]
MLIEIKGVQFVNKGAELMLMAIIEKVELIWPEAEICLQPRLNSSFKQRAKLGALQRLHLRKGLLDLNRISYFIPQKFRDYLRRAWGVVMEADIDIILDASGFSYGDQWPDVSLIQTAKEARRFKQNNKHYIFMPQALGPFSTLKNRKWAKVAFESASFVFARDEISSQQVSAIAEQAKTIVSPDFTNLVAPSLDPKYEYLAGSVAIIPNSKMLSKQNPNKAWRESYLKVLTNAISVLQQNGHQVFLLNHEGESDIKLCQSINKLFDDKLTIVSPDDALQVKAIIGQCALTVCSRFHGCVSSLSQGIPCIGTSWSHKYEQLFDEYQQTEMLLSADITPKELSILVDSTLASLVPISQQLQASSKFYKEKVERMWSVIEELINSPEPPNKRTPSKNTLV